MIPQETGRQDPWTGIVYPPNLGVWANLESTKAITISSNAVSDYTGNIIVGNVGFGNLTISGARILANSNVITLTTTTANIANISVGMTVFSANLSANTTVASIQNSTNGSVWDTWSSWRNQPEEYFYWNSPLINLNNPSVFNMLITTETTGNVEYTIHVSQDGAFDGTESITTVTNGMTDITAFEGQYIIVTANVRQDGSEPTLTSMDITTTNEQITIVRGNISSDTLSGTSSSRQLDLGRNVSYIYNIQMTPYFFTGGTGYTVSGYFTTDYMDETIVTGAFPQIVDKQDGGANIALIDNAGNYIDGRFDCIVYALPEMYSLNNNILVR